ncbi:MAG: flavorubredoxin oxidoreductase [Promethearchaeota archaeon]|jgi:rubredoxin|nr:MAG: flavorubredoxin oxidoreductase [Candidatus Lokiarchaeota archaeon]
MAKWECTACGYIYDEEAEGTPFEDLPDDYTCPVCGVGKDLFEKISD